MLFMQVTPVTITHVSTEEVALVKVHHSIVTVALDTQDRPATMVRLLSFSKSTVTVVLSFKYYVVFRSF